MIFNPATPGGADKVKRYPNMYEYTDFLKKMERPLIGRDKEMGQLQAAMERPELCNAILLAEAGCGKALADDTPIPVNDSRGYARIKDLTESDEVFNEKGEPVRVMGIYPQGLRKPYKITFDDGSHVTCNDEHIWNARDRKGHECDSDFESMTLKQMLDRGVTERVDGRDKPIWYVPCASAVNRSGTRFPFPVYAAGLFISGSFVDNLGRLVITARTQEAAEKAANLAGGRGVDPAEFEDSYRIIKLPNGTAENQTKTLYFSCDDIPYREELLCREDIRVLPASCMLMRLDDRVELLAGLMDGAGSVDSTGITFRSASRLLCRSVQELLSSLGVRSELLSGVGRDQKYVVKLFISGAQYARLLEKDFTPVQKDMAIVSVEPLEGLMNMTCIYVDGESHLFLCTKRHIVTHNTALVQGLMTKDEKRTYLEVNLSKMIANLHNENEMADKLKSLFNEVTAFKKETNREIVLFIDEFHQIVQLSPAAVEVMKPLLADSGTRGIRVIAATTYIEFQQYLASNLPLIERLQRINLPQPSKDVVVSILKGMAQRYGVAQEFKTDRMFEMIYDYTNRYIPSTAQPRKSILVMDSMIGMYRYSHKHIDLNMLAQVIYETEGINIKFKVDAQKIKSELDKRVFAQEAATSAIEARLQICCADLNNKDRPMSSFLFCGSTGVGKRLDDDVMVPVYDSNGATFNKRNGDLFPGDYVFNREGKPVRVMQVFHYQDCEMLEVELADGRKILADPEHLWQYKYRFGKSEWRVADTKTLMRGMGTANNIKFVIPMNKAVQRDEIDYDIAPYGAGSGINDLNYDKGFFEKYKYGSIEQRWDFIKGVFDMYGDISDDEYFNVSCKLRSHDLVLDMQDMLYSLGVSSTVRDASLYVKIGNADKYKFFKDEAKLNIARKAVNSGVNRFRTYGETIGIKSIKPAGKRCDATCILVEDEEHLYQAGQYIVTHNTEISKQLANILFDDDRALIRLDMTEYALPESLERFRQELTQAVWTKPYSVVLLDEIEKACPPVTRLLLQVLDDGRLLDRNNREVTFKNCYIIVTTNAGSEVFESISQYSADDHGSAKNMEKFDKLIRSSIVNTTGGGKFPPELLGRIDCIVPFQPLSEKTMGKICMSRLFKLKKEIKEKHYVDLAFDNKITRYIVQDKMDTEASSGGARAVVSRIEREVTGEIAKYINGHPDVRNGSTLYVCVEGNLMSEHRDQLESEAYILVSDRPTKSFQAMGGAAL